MAKRNRRQRMEAARRARQAEDRRVRERASVPVPDVPVVTLEADAPRFSEAPEHLRRVAEALEAERAAVALRDREVRAARAAGATYTEIAGVLGVTPQAVSKRYGGAR